MAQEAEIKYKLPLCNKDPTSAPHIGGKCFFLCWRCTGIAVGSFLTAFFLFCLRVPITLPCAVSACVLIIPATIDYILIKSCYVKPSNPRRFISGILLGISIALFVCFGLNQILFFTSVVKRA